MAIWSEYVGVWTRTLRIYTIWAIQSIKTWDIRTVLYHIILFITYVLCFVYLYYPNTEMISIILFLVLHIILLFFLGRAGSNFPNWETLRNTSIPPIYYQPTSWDITQIFNFNYADYSVPIILIGWVFVLLALIILVQDSIRVYHNYIPRGMEPTFGKMDGFKHGAIGFLIASTVLIWLFYLLQHIKGYFTVFTQRNRVVNSFVFLFAVLLISSSVYSFQLSRYIDSHLGTVVLS
jgi:hypothetical protein